MSSKSKIYIFDGWQIDPQLSEITKQGVHSQLEPKIMKVLVYLIHHANQVVSREELIESVWETRYASDDVITRAISILRKELAQHKKKDLKKYIKTIPKHGYTLEWTEPIDVMDVEPTVLNDKSKSGLLHFRKFKFKRLHAVALAMLLMAVLVSVLGFKIFT
ncbi:transcriptional regulator [Thalassotalea aquiviva]|uniref:winged helix-turn-helix domain-containing protein n=1 Tax=Thalassotalea aquiviva TaxID=3242415 RepID=UPI00352A2988